MTFKSDVNKVIGLGNGVATIFPFEPMKIYEAEDLKVTLVDPLGNVSEPAQGTGPTDYAVLVAEYPGTGSVVYPADSSTPLPVGSRIIMKRELPLTQEINLRNQGPYSLETQEQLADRGVMISLQQQEVIDRGIAFDITTPDTVSGELANPQSNANRVVAVKADGLGLEYQTPNAQAYITFPASTLDNSLLKANGTSGTSYQSTKVTIDDSDNLNTPGGVSADSLVTVTLSVSGSANINSLSLATPLSVTSGGTGADNAADARNNLGITDGIKPYGYISGLVPKNDGTDPQHDIAVSEGQCLDKNNVLIELTSPIIKRIDAAWQAGSGNGGLSNSLTLAANTWYFIHAIIVAGQADVGFDTSATAANLATDHNATAYRRIGAVRTDASSNIVAFHSVTELAGGGLRTMWDTLFKDQDSVSTTPIDLSVTVPLGIRTRPVLHGRVVNSGSSTNLQMADGDTGAPLRQVTYATTSGGQGWFALNGDFLTNLARQIRWQLSGTASLAEMFTAGWIDERRI